MIPKVIHYCWFGRGQMPELALKCIESWKTYLPDYELRLWNEDSFDVNSLKFTRQAYEKRKFAFITDVVRLYALDEFGGVYMDTDVEILRPIDEFLKFKAFTGFESDDMLPTGIMASEAHSPWLKELRRYYRKKPFVRWNGRLNKTPNTIIISRILKKGGIRIDNTRQTYMDCLEIFPRDYFCPKSHRTGEINITGNTYCIHHFAGSWKKAPEK